MRDDEVVIGVRERRVSRRERDESAYEEGGIFY